MKTKLEVLHLPAPKRTDFTDSCIPVVRYADACAAIEKLEADLELKEALRANAVKRCDELLKELERMALLYQPPYVVEHHGAGGRWDGPAKVL